MTALTDDAGRPYEVGDDVQINAFGKWRPARVTHLGRTRITVAYQSSACGSLNKVRTVLPHCLRRSS